MIRKIKFVEGLHITLHIYTGAGFMKDWYFQMKLEFLKIYIYAILQLIDIVQNTKTVFLCNRRPKKQGMNKRLALKDL